MFRCLFKTFYLFVISPSQIAGDNTILLTAYLRKKSVSRADCICQNNVFTIPLKCTIVHHITIYVKYACFRSFLFKVTLMLIVLICHILTTFHVCCHNCVVILCDLFFIKRYSPSFNLDSAFLPLIGGSY